MGIEPRTECTYHGPISAVWAPEGCHTWDYPIAALRRPRSHNSARWRAEL